MLQKSKVKLLSNKPSSSFCLHGEGSLTLQLSLKLASLKMNKTINKYKHPLRPYNLRAAQYASSAIPNSSSSHSCCPPPTAIFLEWYQVQNLSAGTHHLKVDAQSSAPGLGPLPTCWAMFCPCRSGHQSTSCRLFSFPAHQSWNELLTPVETLESTSNLQLGLKILFSWSTVIFSHHLLYWLLVSALLTSCEILFKLHENWSSSDPWPLIPFCDCL